MTFTAATKEEAAAIAAILNADQLARAALGQPVTYTAADVLRIGRLVAEYLPPKAAPVAVNPPRRVDIQTGQIPQASAAGLAAVEGALR